MLHDPAPAPAPDPETPDVADVPRDAWGWREDVPWETLYEELGGEG